MSDSLPTPRTTLRTGYTRVLIGFLVGLGLGRGAVAAVPAELAGTTWRWVRFVSPSEEISVSEPEHYTLTFSATGWVKLRADCNHGAGGAAFPGPGFIQVDALALTHKMCPQGTLSALFSSDVTQAVRWYLRDGKLCLELPADAGVLWLGAAGRDSTAPSNTSNSRQQRRASFSPSSGVGWANAQRGLPTPRTTLRTGYVRVLVFCKACRHQANADLDALIAAGRGDVPLRELRFRCVHCSSRLTDFVVTGGANVKPW